jgi:hypothetical protein
MYITNICNIQHYSVYIHLLNVTYVHKNFISCCVGLSFQKLKYLKMLKKILRPTTVFSCGTMEEDWEGSDCQRKHIWQFWSVFFPTTFLVDLNICLYFWSYSPSFNSAVGLVGLNIFLKSESVLISF